MRKVVQRILAAGLAAGLLGASPAPAGAADVQYEALAKAYYGDYFKLNPLVATYVGVHDYDAELGDFSPASVTRQDALDNDTLAKLAAIDRSQLSAGVALDATLLSNSLKDDLLSNDTLAEWRHNPDDYTQAACGAVFGVMSKDYAPPKNPFRLCDRARAPDSEDAGAGSA